MSAPQRLYDLDDICLIPRVVSTIQSRDEIDPSVELFPGVTLTVPIIAAPMMDVCDGKMALLMREVGGFGFIHRFQSIGDQVAQFYASQKQGGCAVGLGIEEKKRFDALYTAGCRYFCLDVANGGSIMIHEDLLNYYAQYSDAYWIVGNIASLDTYQYCSSFDNVWGVRCGIAGGCFIKGTKVTTKHGRIPIEKIQPGTEVLTHRGIFEKVTHTLQRKEDEYLIEINGSITCTKNHEFYVVKAKYVSILDENNLEDYAEWVSAEDLNEDYMLIEVAP